MRSALLALLLLSLVAGCASPSTPPTTTTTPTTTTPVAATPTEALNVTVDFSGDPSGAAQTFPFNVTAAYRNVTMRVQYAPSTPASPILGLKVELADPAGKATGEGSGSCDLGNGVMTVASSCERSAPAAPGEWKVVASGSGEVTAKVVVVLA